MSLASVCGDAADGDSFLRYRAAKNVAAIAPVDVTIKSNMSRLETAKKMDPRETLVTTCLAGLLLLVSFSDIVSGQTGTDAATAVDPAQLSDVFRRAVDRAIPAVVAVVAVGRSQVTTTAAPDGDTVQYAPETPSEDMARRLGYTELAGGIFISHVQLHSIASRADVSAGMLLLQVGQKPVHSVFDFRQAMKDQSLEKGVLVLIGTPRQKHFALFRHRLLKSESSVSRSKRRSPT